MRKECIAVSIEEVIVLFDDAVFFVPMIRSELIESKGTSFLFDAIARRPHKHRKVLDAELDVVIGRADIEPEAPKFGDLLRRAWVGIPHTDRPRVDLKVSDGL